MDDHSPILRKLVELCDLTPEQVAAGMELCSATEGLTLEAALLKMEAVSGDDVAIALAHVGDLQPLSLEGFRFDPALIEDLPVPLMRRNLMLPISRIGKTLTVAVPDPFSILALEGLSSQSGMRVQPVVVSEARLRDAVEKFLVEQAGGELQDLLSDYSSGMDIELAGGGRDDFDIDSAMELADDKPVIRIVNSIIMESLRKRASDIHIEPELDTCRVRYRVDGVLVEAGAPPKHLLPAIASRVKIMANLDIAERRIPQDGRCRIRALDKDVDIRVSVLPIIHGEKIVMRILDKSNLPDGLGDLGLDPQSFDAFSRALSQPYGMIFVTGPTGSGKTTTLYSALQELNKPDVNVITVEDPVEYQLRGINQVQTHAEVGLTFASGLRSILRQDPDIVLVGEVRDLETASIAVQAALTGHLVLSTLHTNDAVGAISRLENMGIEPFMLASALILSQAQRLYRRLCPSCRSPVKMTMNELQGNHFTLDGFSLTDAKFHAPAGCPKCNQLGYRGRGAIMEILEISDEIRAAILAHASGTTLLEIGVRQGTVTLQRAGLNKAKEGLTSIEEVLRITRSV